VLAYAVSVITDGFGEFGEMSDLLLDNWLAIEAWPKRARKAKTRSSVSVMVSECCSVLVFPVS